MSVSKLFSVRVPVDELEAVEAVFARFPGASPALIIRAVLLASPRLWVANALAKHAARKVKGDIL